MFTPGIGSAGPAMLQIDPARLQAAATPTRSCPTAAEDPERAALHDVYGKELGEASIASTNREYNLIVLYGCTT